MKKDIESVYRPDVLNASYQPDPDILKGVLEDVKENGDLLHESSEETEGNDIAVNRFLDEALATNLLLNEAYRVGGLTMNIIVKRTYEKDKRPLPIIIPPHFVLNRQIDPELDRYLAADETLLDGRIAEFQIMKQEMKAFGEVPLVPDETSDLSRQFLAGVVDIANLYDIAQKYPPKRLMERKP